MMRIGTRISPDWLDRPEDLRFLTQIGVDAVDITMDMVPGYLESGGAATRDGMKMVVDKLADVGLVIERANCLSSQFHDAYLGGPNAEQETRNACINAELCGEFDIPVLGVQPYTNSLVERDLPPLVEYVEGRGGYKHAKFDLREALAAPRAADALRRRSPVATTHQALHHNLRGRRTRWRKSRHARKRPTRADAPRLPSDHQQLRIVRPPLQRSSITRQRHHILRRHAIRIWTKHLRGHQALRRAKSTLPRPLPQRRRHDTLKTMVTWK